MRNTYACMLSLAWNYTPHALSLSQATTTTRLRALLLSRYYTQFCIVRFTCTPLPYHYFTYYYWYVQHGCIYVGTGFTINDSWLSSASARFRPALTPFRNLTSTQLFVRNILFRPPQRNWYIYVEEKYFYRLTETAVNHWNKNQILVCMTFIFLTKSLNRSELQYFTIKKINKIKTSRTFISPYF